MFILPVCRDNPVRKIPYVVIALIAINAIVFLPTCFGDSQQIYKTYGFIPAEHMWQTVLTSMFLHGGFMHILGNMYFLWMFGNQVENLFGKWIFASVYLLSGFGGAALHYLLNPTSQIPCIGASGAISGIVGCFFVLFPKAKFDLVIYFRFTTIKEIPTHTHVAVGAWLAEQTLLGLLSQALGAFSVAFWAHVGGFAVGAIAALIFILMVPAKKRRTAMRGKRWYMREEFNKEEKELTTLQL